VQHPSKKDTAVIEKVEHIVEPLCNAEGMELVFVEYQRESSGRILRVYIDKPGGVKLDDCVLISRQMGDLLDVYMEDVGPYNLEVSSPGSDRPIGRMADYERFKGCETRIKTIQSVDGRKNFRGVLMGVSEENIINIMVDGKAVAIPFREIRSARLIQFNGEYPCSSQK